MPANADIYVRYPKLIGTLGNKLAIDVIARARRCRIRHGGANNLATPDAGQALFAHETLDRAARRVDTFPLELPPDLLCTIDLHIDLPDALNVRAQHVIALGAWAAQCWLFLSGHIAAIR